MTAYMCVLAVVLIGCPTAKVTNPGTADGDGQIADSTEETTAPDSTGADTTVEPDTAVADSTPPPDVAPDTTADTVDDSGPTPDSVPPPEDTVIEDSTPVDDTFAMDTTPPDTTPADTTPADTTPADAAPPEGKPDWYKAFGGLGADEIKGVAADSLGNVYVVGIFTETLTIGTETFNPAQPGQSKSDTFVASFDSKGAFRWAHGFGAAGADTAYEVDVDGKDNVYVIGSHQSDLTIGAETLTCAGSSDLFLVSYDLNGVQLWAKSWGGEFGESPRDLSVNTEGDIFVTGSFQGTMTADGITATSGSNFGLSEIFVLAVDGKTHNAMWIKVFHGPGYDVGTALVADKDRNAVIGISYQQTLEIGDGNGTVFDSGGDNFNAGIVRLDNDGNVLWANEYGGTGSEEIIGLDMDTTGKIYATGVFSGTASFGGPNLVATSAHDIMLAGYAGNGTHLWSVAYTGDNFDQAQDLEVSGNGIYIVGRFKNDLTFGSTVLTTAPDDFDVFVGRFSTTDGAPVWVQALGSAGPDLGNGVGIGGDGGVFAGGHVKGDVTFNGILNPAPGAKIDSFLIRLSE
jgi:hypothetical protein